MSKCCRRGREKSVVVVAEKKEGEREEGSASSGSESSASKTSSMSEISFSRGAKGSMSVHHDMIRISKTYDVHRDRRCDAQSS